jgi:hypothetical protein
MIEVEPRSLGLAGQNNIVKSHVELPADLFELLKREVFRNYCVGLHSPFLMVAYGVLSNAIDNWHLRERSQLASNVEERQEVFLEVIPKRESLERGQHLF